MHRKGIDLLITAFVPWFNFVACTAYPERNRRVHVSDRYSAIPSQFTKGSQSGFPTVGLSLSLSLIINIPCCHLPNTIIFSVVQDVLHLVCCWGWFAVENSMIKKSCWLIKNLKQKMTGPGVFGKQSRVYLIRLFTGNGNRHGFMAKNFPGCLIYLLTVISW